MHNNIDTNTSYSQFVCLSGMPRSGSTLLSAILSQNPLIHAEGNSAVCQLMWDMHVSCFSKANEQLRANCRENTIFDLISQIPHIYYKNIPEKIVVDKCRSWTLETNIQMLKTYIDKNIKIIVLERNVLDVVKSFVKLYRKNGIKDEELENKLVITGSEPIMRSLEGIKWAKNNNTNNTFLFIHYEDLVNNTKETIKKMYDFCGWEPFKHDFNNIISKYPENDDVYNLPGQHSIRPSVKKDKSHVPLSAVLEKKCNIIDALYFNK
jgi:sulfotransferase